MIELLAPAGNREAFSAALECGADAIYLGGQQFGARQYAPNFSRDELAQSIRLAHLLGVKVYITVNTLVDEAEMPELRDYLGYLYEVGADAAILQDIGVARMARRIAPKLPIHASTQMTVYDLPGANLLADYGFSRVILARELSMAEISAICRKARCEIETFIHGALCICYSGQCLMSSMIGGRSGNRGRCAQPCRLPYTLQNQAGRNMLLDQGIGEYLLSPKDFQTIEVLPQLIEAGVASLKIEGRMKRAEYVAVVVDAYRRGLDRALAVPDHYKVPGEDLRDLEQIFNRGFTSGHLFGKNGRDMMSDRRPNNRGVLIGRTSYYLSRERQLQLKLEGPLAVGDIVEAWVKVGGRVNIEVTSMQSNGVEITEANAGQEVCIPCSEYVKPGDRIFKTFDARLTEKVRSWYAKPYARRRIPVSMKAIAAVDENFTIEVVDRDGNRAAASSKNLGQLARNKPLTIDALEIQCAKLGNTPFRLESFSANLTGEVMLPVSEINDTRRRAVEMLEEARLAQFARSPLVAPSIELMELTARMIEEYARPALAVNIDTKAQAAAALASGADWILVSGERFHSGLYCLADYEELLAMIRKYNAKAIFSLPRIIRESRYNEVSTRLSWFADLRPDAVGVANLSAWAQVRQYPHLKVHADYPLHFYNAEALTYARDQDAISATLSPELTLQQVQFLGQKGILPLECLVHGRMTLMVSEFCAIGSYLGCTGRKTEGGVCQSGDFVLHDRKGESFPVITDDSCRMFIQNAKELSMLPYVQKLAQLLGISRLRIEACHMDPSEVGRVTGLYRKAIDTGASGLSVAEVDAAEHQDITRGHYFRGVL